ncbi:hypothetical protein EFQ99_28235 [Rhizobium vallis]|uniref:Uncharacterized protein n=1 Tax=Rhizobium vallis TaxID=634290 RepID=A0A432PCB7_9HYPH|nr:hypothetical protein EFQ99_28235 [Rhizobium vallis]
MSSLAMMCRPGVLTIVPTLRSFSSTSSDEIDLGSRYASGIGITIGAGDEGRQIIGTISLWLQAHMQPINLDIFYHVI